MLKESEINKIQAKINYKFTNKKLLQQAFTRKSYSAFYGGVNNEIMEFFGDRILDFAVIRKFCLQFCQINNKNEFVSAFSASEFCKMDIELVKNSKLAEQITKLGLTKYIQVKEPREKTTLKNKADLFEAILGAVAIDSDWNLETIEKVYVSMMADKNSADFEEFQDNFEFNYIEAFEDLLWKHRICKSSWQFIQASNGIKCRSCVLINGKACEIIGFGAKEQLAVISASRQGYNLLKLLAEKEPVAEETCTEQLNLLFKTGFICEPDFKFEYFPANSNFPEDLWRCHGSIFNLQTEYQAEDSTMFEAQEQVSCALLCDFLGIENSEYNYEELNSIVHGEGLLKLIMSKYSNGEGKAA